jgi:Fusaric acid resistance protein-like
MTLIQRAPLRFCLQTTIAALLAFALAQFLNIPLHGLWMVLTAVVVIQMSVGGSLRATTEYVIGTFGGAIYASAIGALVPHATAIGAASVLALGIAPLAYAAALNPSFRVAPLTAAMVLLLSAQLDEGPIESGFYRLLEVALGGGVAVAVSLLVFPKRAFGLGLDSASRVLEQLARALPELLAGFTKKVDVLENRRIQDEIGRTIAAFQTMADEARREHLVNPIGEPNPAILVRISLRLRHDLVIIGRSGIEPLPHSFAQRVGPTLARIGASSSDYLLASARALKSRRAPPPIDPVRSALAAYASEMTAARNEGLTQTLSINELERIYALGFALHQLQQDLLELAGCLQEQARVRGLTGAGPADSTATTQTATSPVLQQKRVRQ